MKLFTKFLSVLMTFALLSTSVVFAEVTVIDTVEYNEAALTNEAASVNEELSTTEEVSTPVETNEDAEVEAVEEEAEDEAPKYTKPATAAEAFSDVNGDEEYYKAVNFMYQAGIMTGRHDKTFRIDETLTRAQLIKVAVLSAMKFERVPSISLLPYAEESCFTDFEKGKWYNQYACYGKSRGWIQGKVSLNESGEEMGAEFKPKSKVNFVQALKMANNAIYREFPEGGNNAWYKQLVDAAEERNFTPLTITDFKQEITRGEAADMFARIITYVEGTQEEYLGMKGDYKVTYDDIKENNDIYGEEYMPVATTVHAQAFTFTTVNDHPNRIFSIYVVEKPYSNLLMENGPLYTREIAENDTYAYYYISNGACLLESEVALCNYDSATNLYLRDENQKLAATFDANPETFANGDNSYINEEFGFSVNLVDGWRQTSVDRSDFVVKEGVTASEIAATEEELETEAEEAMMETEAIEAEDAAAETPETDDNNANTETAENTESETEAVETEMPTPETQENNEESDTTPATEDNTTAI